MSSKIGMVQQLIRAKHKKLKIMYNMKLKNQAFVPSIFHAMDKLFQDEFPTQWKTNQPAVNIIEHDNAYELQMMAPGLQKSDFKVEVDKSLLTVSFNHVKEENSTTPKYVRREFQHSSFSRTFTLNENLNPEGIEATYENGILHVHIPKLENKTVEVKSVEVK